MIGAIGQSLGVRVCVSSVGGAVTQTITRMLIHCCEFKSTATPLDRLVAKVAPGGEALVDQRPTQCLLCMLIKAMVTWGEHRANENEGLRPVAVVEGAGPAPDGGPVPNLRHRDSRTATAEIRFRERRNGLL